MSYAHWVKNSPYFGSNKGATIRFFVVEGCGVGWERERAGRFCEIKKRTLFCPQKKKKKKKVARTRVLFVCVEVLRPSQPNRVVSSAVSLPNHTFTGQT